MNKVMIINNNPIKLSTILAELGYHSSDYGSSLHGDLVFISDTKEITWNSNPYREINPATTTIVGVFSANTLTRNDLKDYAKKSCKTVEMTVAQISEKLGIPNLKIVKG